MKTHQDKSTTSETSKRLKVFRESLKLSQTEFGAKIGKTQPTITKYESGFFIIPIGVVKQIHKVGLEIPNILAASACFMLDLWSSCFKLIPLIFN